MLIRAIAGMLSARDREGLAELLMKMTALQFLVLIESGKMDFMMHEIIKLMRDYDAGPNATENGTTEATMVHTVEVTSSNTGDRPVPYCPGSGSVCFPANG